MYEKKRKWNWYGSIYFNCNFLFIASFNVECSDTGSDYEYSNRRTPSYTNTNTNTNSNNGSTTKKPYSSSTPSSSSSSSGKKYPSNSYNSYDSYDEGYDAVYEDEDYDWDRYYSDDDYADGVDDAMDELDW